MTGVAEGEAPLRDQHGPNRVAMGSRIANQLNQTAHFTKHLARAASLVRAARRSL